MLTLPYRVPFDWQAMLGYLGARATPGVEAVSTEGVGWYSRTVCLDGHCGCLVAEPATAAPLPTGRSARAIRVTLSSGLAPVARPVAARLRRLFDLDAKPRAIAAHLARDRRLAPLVARRRGLRAPGAFDPFELAVRAVLGQQVSVRGATTLAGRLAAAVAEPVPPSSIAPGSSLSRFPITAARLADARPEFIARLGITRFRARCLVALARAAAGDELPELLTGNSGNDPTALVNRLRMLPGIGPWTAMYIAMRGLGWQDAFPEGDLGLRKAMGGISPARLRQVAERWRPWRAYAAQHLWAAAASREP